MNFLIAVTFTDSLSRLTGEEQKAVKLTAFELQVNPASPGLSFHKLDRARDKNFWSVRAGLDIRIIVHKSQGSLLLCYADHHDKAYDWAMRRKLETHPTTGAAQLVEIRETVKEIVVPVFVEEKVSPPDQHLLFESKSDEELLKYGVPSEWLADVRKATENTLLGLTDHIPAEAAEALLELATGGKPRIPQLLLNTENPFEHPDAQRRFRIMSDVDELRRALDFPWEKWTVFLHPEQRELVEKQYNGPARVSGSAGTGKTVVALHRAVHLARLHPNSRVLLATFSDTLSRALRIKLRRLVQGEPRLAERIDVHALDELGQRLYKANSGKARMVTRSELSEIIRNASSGAGEHKFSLHFLLSEWDEIVDAWQLTTWEAYRDVARLGRKTRLHESQRRTLWSVFEKVWQDLENQNLLTFSSLFTILASMFGNERTPPFDFVVLDESQDVSIAQLRFLSAFGGNRPDALFFAGDLGQRIFQQTFSWKSVGVDIRGRARHLRINYRTSHQIRRQADRLLGPEIADADGNTERRDDTVSVFNGPPPVIRVLKSVEDEVNAVVSWLAEHVEQGVVEQEIGIFVRSSAQLGRAKDAVQIAGMQFRVLDENLDPANGFVSIGTMHLAKGLEFRAVVVMACDDEIIPLQERIEQVGDDADLQEVYDTERHLLYVACTRARDFLLVCGVEPSSEFLDDMLASK